MPENQHDGKKSEKKDHRSEESKTERIGLSHRLAEHNKSSAGERIPLASESHESEGRRGGPLSARIREGKRGDRQVGPAKHGTPAAPIGVVEGEPTSGPLAAESVPEASAAAPSTAPVVPDDEAKDLLRKLRRQQKLRIEHDLAEAQDLERRARDMTKKAKADQKFRADLAKHSGRVAEMAPDLGFDPNRPITQVPPLPGPEVSQVEFVPIQEGRSYVRITYNSALNQYLYEVVEPELSSTEKEVLEFIRDTLVRTLEGRRDNAPEDWESVLNDAVERTILDHSILIDDVAHQKILYYITRDFIGYGPIDVLMRDPMIEDISCDGPGIPVYIFHRQYESVKSNVMFKNEPNLDGFVIRLAQRCGKHISIADPLLDATLPDTSRLQASFSREVTTRGSTFTIRKFRADPLTPPDLVRLGTMSAEMAAYFWMAMEEGQSLVYAGGTASGKTTTLNAVSQFIPPEKKVVSIEDTREINLPHENWIASLTRSGFGGEMVGGTQTGTITMYKLLESALRQRPEYLIVGEVRGPEALTLFQAMATGHATYSTLHADSVMSAVYRLENNPINIPRIMLQTLDAVSIQVLVRVGQKVTRRCKEVVEIIGIDPESGDLLTNTVFQWDSSRDRFDYRGKSEILETIRERRNVPMEQVEADWADRSLVIEWMVEKGIRHIGDVANIISEYYRKPQELLEKVRQSMKNRPMKGAIVHVAH